MEYRNISETLTKRDKKAIRRARTAFPGKSMVNKIPRDHKGLYACELFNHGIQAKIKEEEEEEEEEKSEHHSQ